MAVRVFTQFDDEKLVISGREFPLKALPSAKAAKITDLGQAFGAVFGEVGDEMDSQKITEFGVKILNVKFDLFSFGLDIPKEHSRYQELVDALDEASIPELWWAFNQILEVNGGKGLEKLIKNLISRLDQMMPDLQSEIIASLRRYIKMTTVREELTSTGTTELSESSQENLITLVPAS